MLHLSGDEFEKRELINKILASALSCGRFDVRESTSARSLPRQELEAISAIPKLVELMVVQDPTFGAEAFLKLRNNGHALLHSDKYPLALMPDGAQTNDIACIIQGASTPLLLRQEQDGFVFVGECYVHGAMYGEAVNWREDEADDFVLT